MSLTSIVKSASGLLKNARNLVGCPITQKRNMGVMDLYPDKRPDVTNKREEFSASLLPIGERGNSKLFIAKMATMFRFQDIDNDGFITWADMEKSVVDLSRLGGLNKKEMNDFRECAEYQWHYFFDLKGNAGLKDALTFDMYLEAMQEIVNIPEVDQKGNFDTYIAPYFFKAIDLDDDGSISAREYALLFKAHCQPEGEAFRAFDSIDVNQDGLVQYDEYVLSSLEYMFSEDETKPVKKLYGSLIDPATIPAFPKELPADSKFKLQNSD